MTPEEWRGIRVILESALEMDARERAAFLDRACEADAMRREIESLIQAHDQANEAIITGDALRNFSATETENFSLRAGTRIGQYEILDRIAEGGMGAVYRAIRADGQYKQKVAIKLVRLDSGGFVSTRRFRNEQQILASLDHPNIAKCANSESIQRHYQYDRGHRIKWFQRRRGTRFKRRARQAL